MISIYAKRYFQKGKKKASTIHFKLSVFFHIYIMQSILFYNGWNKRIYPGKRKDNMLNYLVGGRDFKNEKKNIKLLL